MAPIVSPGFEVRYIEEPAQRALLVLSAGLVVTVRWIQGCQLVQY
jgi:hypothetical protein